MNINYFYLNIYFLAHLTSFVNAALIDDELANTKVSKQLICEPQHYTIYERFQDIEHKLEGNELIFDLWQNWGDNRNDVQFRLKINKQRDQELTDGKGKAKVLNDFRGGGFIKLLSFSRSSRTRA